MSMNRDIAVLVGTLRKDSFNRKMAHTLIELAPSGLKLGIVEIGPLPHYNQDLETPSPPAPWVGRARCRSEEHTSELQSLTNLVCRLLLEKKKKKKINHIQIKHGEIK